jgi:putative ubiquitin-RnfH superfamily antitoxin RatB of RatAB toxin-antitoxin module
MASIVVTVAWAAPSVQELVRIELAAGARVRDAIARSGLVTAYALDPGALGVAVFGRRATLDTVLANGDRVEITRALAVDAKEARRRRAQSAPVVRGAPRAKRRAT